MTVGHLRLRVLEVVTETADARSILLHADDEGGQPIEYRPGQFLTIRIPDQGSGSLARCYSLSSAPSDGAGHLTVTVKKVPGGRGSSWICDEVRPGDILEALRPAGTFTPRDLGVDLLLVAAGSGITPVMSILRAALNEGRADIRLMYANRDERSVIFASDLAQLERDHSDRLVVDHWLESVQGLPTERALRARLAPYSGRDAFVCGPAPFMAATRRALAALGATEDRIHTEEFVSLSGDPFAARPAAPADAQGPTTSLEVELDGEHRTLSWPQGQVLLDVLLDAGVAAPYSCREGACSACACVVLKGDVRLDRNEVLDEADLADGIVLACQARTVSDSVRISYDA